MPTNVDEGTIFPSVSRANGTYNSDESGVGEPDVNITMGKDIRNWWLKINTDQDITINLFTMVAGALDTSNPVLTNTLLAANSPLIWNPVPGMREDGLRVQVVAGVNPTTFAVDLAVERQR